MQSNNYFSEFHRSSNGGNNSLANNRSDFAPLPEFAGNSRNNNTQDDFVADLRPVDEIPSEYRSVFANYAFFNAIQTRVLDTVLYSDIPVVVSAPTGSGKTVIFELAIVRFLIGLQNYNIQMPFKIVYVAPMKALCEERLVDWHCKFASLGLTCISVTGDSDNFDFQSLLNNNLIITTPEKWDSLTRRWRDNKKLVGLVKLFMIDEVHLLTEDQRGPTLEAIVSRMKTIQDSLMTDESDQLSSQKIRFVAVSATIPNVEDIAAWLSTATVQAKSFKFGDEMRPVKLKKVVLGYHYNPQTSTPFKFDIMLNYKLQSIMLQHAEGKPTLIFCSTRKNVEMTSRHITQNITITLNPLQRQILQSATSAISDHKIKQMLINGVSYHHAGLSIEDRKIIEDLFRNANLPILVTTSTLAMGVNLPAHLVIIKSTKYYSNGEYRDYSECMLLQMIGRAGRPQFDTSATAIILTTAADKEKYENMVGGDQPVESNLHKHLAEHLNAEVVLHTITDLGVAMQWLTSTFLYIRARKHPRFYGLPMGLTLDQIDKKLLDMCQIEINRLARGGMLFIDQDDIRITPTGTGLLMAKYCVAFDTMQLFTQVSGNEILQQALTLISKCQEFSEIYLRVNDKKTLNLLNNCRDRETIRFPFNGKVKTVDMKINCIIQAVFGCLQILEPSLVTESQKIMRIGERLSNCLAEYLETKGNCYAALLSAVTLAKCFHARLWENSPFVSKQLSGIGSAYSSALVAAGKTTFRDLLHMNPRDIERIINRKAPTGNTIQEQIEHLPDYELTLEEVIGEEHFVVNLSIRLRNAVLLQMQSSVDVNNTMNLLVGDTNNHILLYEKYKHSYFIENPEILKTLEFPKSYDQEIKVHLISEDWVGIDCMASLLPTTAKQAAENNEENSMKNDRKRETSRKPSHIQTFVDTFFKKTKPTNTNRKQKQVSASKLPRKSDNKENIIDTSPTQKTPPKLLQRQNSVNIDYNEMPSKQQQSFTNYHETSSKHLQRNSSNLDEHLQNHETPSRHLQRKSSKSDQPLQPQNSANVIDHETPSRHMQSQNFDDHETSNCDNADSENKTQTEAQIALVQKIIEDSIQEFQSLNKKQVQKTQETDKGYHIPPDFLTMPDVASPASVVRSNDYSATVKRTPTQNTSNKQNNTGFKSTTPLAKKKQFRFKKNLNCSINFEHSLHTPSSSSENDVAKSISLMFKYSPRKKAYNRETNESSETNEVRPKTEVTPTSMSIKTEVCTSEDSKSTENLQKTIKWRSPLVISPVIKYSPIFGTGRKNSDAYADRSQSNSNWNNAPLAGERANITFGVTVNDSADISAMSSTTPSETSSTLKPPQAPRPSLKENMRKNSPNFPLSDRSYMEFISQKQQSTAKSSSDANRFTEDELVSTSLLESLGLAQKKSRLSQNQPKRVIKPTKTASVSEYYKQLVSDSQKEIPKRTETPQKKQIAEKSQSEDSRNASGASNLNNRSDSDLFLATQQKNANVTSNLNSRSDSDIFLATQQKPSSNQNTLDLSFNDSIMNISNIPLTYNIEAKTAVNKNQSQHNQLFDLSPGSNNNYHQDTSPELRAMQNYFARKFSQSDTNFNNSQSDMAFNNSHTQRIPQQRRSFSQNQDFNFNIAVPHEPPVRLPHASHADANVRKRLGRYRTSSYNIMPSQPAKREYEPTHHANCQCFDCSQHFRAANFSYYRPTQTYTHPEHYYPSTSTSQCYSRPPRFFEHPPQGYWEPAPPYNYEHPYENAKRPKFEMHHHIPPDLKRNSFHDYTNMQRPVGNNRSLRDRQCSFNQNPPFTQTYMPDERSPYFNDFERGYSAYNHPDKYNHGDKQFLMKRYLHSVEQKQMQHHRSFNAERQAPCFRKSPLDLGITIDDFDEMPEDEFSE